MSVEFIKCTLSETDIDLLSSLGKQTFHETFEGMNSEKIMSAYLKSAFNKKQLRKEVKNTNSVFLILFSDARSAGYMKLNSEKAQTDFKEKNGFEIERIYLKKEYQGYGFGCSMIQKAVSIAKDRNKSYIWLGVWKRHTTAISFYEHMGFKKSGTHSFMMGKERQEDYIMRKELDQ
ncbi:MAG TPA: GNAT family N-acetyltransferase [Balneolales bacterium]|nr:GNAT family N-acetyltransferase [Balneolales bacterium]